MPPYHCHQRHKTILTTASFSSTALAADYSVQTPSQIGLAMTSDPTTSININWTTIDTTLTDEE